MRCTKLLVDLYFYLKLFLVSVGIINFQTILFKGIKRKYKISLTVAD